MDDERMDRVPAAGMEGIGPVPQPHARPSERIEALVMVFGLGVALPATLLATVVALHLA